MRLAILLVLLLASSRADAEPWWKQFYLYTGYRDVGTLDRASGQTFAIGYRFDRAHWGIDVAALDHTSGRDEGMHQLLRVTGYRAWKRMWFGGGVSYAVVDGWTTTDVPHRTGHGLTLDAVAGVELASAGFVRSFVQVDVTVPTFTARDRYDSMDSSIRPVAIELALGLRF